jgi:hypothetical protein
MGLEDGIMQTDLLFADAPAEPLPERDALISDCGRYRYLLTRRWGQAGDPCVCWVMLNPSTADALQDDATIRRCVNFSKAWGAGSLVVVNLFAYRATQPADLWAAHEHGIDIVGEDNDMSIDLATFASSRCIVAWGGNAERFPGRAARVLELIGRGVECLTVTKDGHPGHPVRLPANLEPRPFEVTG